MRTLIIIPLVLSLYSTGYSQTTNLEEERSYQLQERISEEYLRISELSEFAELKFTEGSTESMFVAGEAWREVANGYIEIGSAINASNALNQASNAYLNAGKWWEAGSAAEEALVIAMDEKVWLSTYKSNSIKSSTTGNMSETSLLDNLIDTAENQLSLVEAAMPNSNNLVKANIRSNPPGLEVQYRPFILDDAPLTDVTTNNTLSLQPKSYLFSATLEDGTTLTRKANCWINCTVDF